MVKKSLRDKIDRVLSGFPNGKVFSTDEIYSVIEHKSATKLSIANILHSHPRVRRIEGDRHHRVMWMVGE